MDPLRPVAERVRAVEIVTRVFAGLTPLEARRLTRAAEPPVRARLAWALTCKPCAGFTGILLDLAGDPHPLVRRCALEGLLERYLELDNVSLVPMLEGNLGHSDKRVRQLAARLAAQLPKSQWDALKNSFTGGTTAQRLGGGLAIVWREPEVAFKTNVLELALSAWPATADAAQRLDAVRLMMVAMGDIRVNPTNPVPDTFELGAALPGRDREIERVRKALRTGFSATAQLVNVESARLLAMLQEDDEKLARQVVARITFSTPAALDWHYLAVLARLPAPRSQELTTRTAAALAGLDRKLAALPAGARAIFHQRLADETRRLFQRDPALAEAWLQHRDFAGETAVALSPLLNAGQQARAAALILRPVTRNTNFTWSEALTALLDKLPPEQARPLFRRQWGAPVWREQMTLKLAAKPDAADRAKFVAGLDSPRLEIVTNCLGALLALPRDDSPQNLAVLVRLLARTAPDVRLGPVRQQALALLNRQASQQFKVEEGNATPAKRMELYQPIQAWFATAYPAWAKSAMPAAAPPPARPLDNVPWARGNAARGAALFSARGCADCHGGAGALGPDLAPAVDRLRPADLVREITEPDRHVGQAFQATEWRLRNGAVVTGFAAHQTFDFYLVQTARGLVRLPAGQVSAIQPASHSLMPPNLLKNVTPLGIADLYAFLKTLVPGQ